MPLTQSALLSPYRSRVPCDSDYTCIVWQLAHQLEWGFHMARVNCLSWAPDSTHLASGSLDTAIIIWDAANPAKHITYKSTLPFGT